MRLGLMILLLGVSIASSTVKAEAAQLRASAIASAGTVLVGPTQRMGFTVGLPMAGLIAADGRRIISGFWRWGIQGTTDASDPLAAAFLPVATTLGTAVPNPFRSRTTIPIQIAGAGGTVIPTRIEVFDITGRRVAELIDADLTPGFYTVWWNRVTGSGRKLGSGIYFVHMTAGNVRKTSRLVIID